MRQWWSTIPEWTKPVILGAIITVGVGICAFIATKAFPAVIRWWKERRINKLSWSIRDHAAKEKTKEPNIHCFPRETLISILGKDAKYFREVIESMELKGWARRVRHPADCWDIN